MTDSLTCTTYSGTLCKCFVLLPADPTAPCLVIRPDYAPLAANASSANKFTTTIIIFRPSGTRWEQRVDRCRAAHSKTHNKVLRRLSGGCLGDVEGKCQVREEWQRVGWGVNAECNMARIVAILELKLNSEKEEQSEVGNLLTVSPQFTDSPWTDRKQRPPGWSHYLSSSCLFAPQGDDAGLITGSRLCTDESLLAMQNI